MKHKLFLSLLLALFPLFLLAQLPVTRSSTKPKAKPKTEQAGKPTPAKKTNQPAKPSGGQRTSASASSSRQSISSQTFTVNGVSFDMMYVKGGTFIMGATSEQGSDAYGNEKPTHRVTLSSYYIGQYEVTQALWKAVMGSNPSKRKGNNLPVENVSWDDCQNFLLKLNAMTGQNFRLPTEAEWEYAARGGNRSRNYQYSGSNNLGNVAWYNDNSGKQTHIVGIKLPNELGINDMSGNVWEWCQDWKENYSSSAQTNPTGPESGSCHVIRGGSWSFSAESCRVSYRHSLTPDAHSGILGLRLALSL